jgi:hypothetical protein
MYERPEVSKEPADRLNEWMHRRGYSHQKLANATGRFEKQYSKSTIDSICSARRPLPEGLAKIVQALDAEIVARENGDRASVIRWQYLMNMDPHKTVGDYQGFLAVYEELKAAYDRVSREELAFDQLFYMAGYSMEFINHSVPGVDTENLYMISIADGGAPLMLISNTEMTELRQELVDYTAYRVQRLLKKTGKRKEAVSDGVNHEENN